MYLPSWTSLPSPTLPHPSLSWGPVLYNNFPLAVCFTYASVYVSMLLSQSVPPSSSLCWVHKSVLCVCVSIPCSANIAEATVSTGVIKQSWVSIILIFHWENKNLNYLNKIYDYCLLLLEPELLMLNSKENFIKQMFSTYLYSSCALNIWQC